MVILKNKVEIKDNNIITYSWHNVKCYRYGIRMEEKLKRLYKECVLELNNIGIDLSEENVGKIDISFSKRKTKRYGCCKQEEPDKTTSYRKNRKLYYKKFLYRC